MDDFEIVNVKATVSADGNYEEVEISTINEGTDEYHEAIKKLISDELNKNNRKRKKIS